MTDTYAYAYGALQALQERGMPVAVLVKLARVSEDADLIRIASQVVKMAHFQKEASSSVSLSDAYGPAAALAAGATGLAGANLYGASDADTLSNDVRRLLGMPTQSRAERALGFGAGEMPLGSILHSDAQRNAGNYIFGDG